MRKKYNEFYNNCKYLQFIYPKNYSINHKKVIGYCKYYMIDIYKLRMKDGIMCCINKSPYTFCNCKFFKSKNKNMNIFDYMNVNKF